MEDLKVTPLRGVYEEYGGKIVDFAGYELPTQFKGFLHEHHTVREKAGLFDVSHMGEVMVTGKDAGKFIQYLMTNDINILKDNEVLYTFMCNEDGGVIDDLLVYKFAEDEFFLVINASNKDKDVKWIMDHKGDFHVEIVDESDSIAQLALQGPLAEEILQKIVDIDLQEIKFFKLKRDVLVNGKKCLVSRTGYTGEDGFEIYCKPEDAKELWHAILNAGKEEGAQPIGLGARDTLRFEASLLLYGNEMDETITPLEVGMGFFVKLKVEEDFIGKDALIKQKAEGVTRKLVGFELLDKGIPRHGYEVIKDGKVIGHVTTGYKSPTLNKAIGLALVEEQYSKIGTEFNIKVRKKELKAVVIDKRFYTKKTKTK
ncbi:glycine cleavage system protein T [Clostridium botulinum]|uniref:glycine cleavage system aminomethyltransferase GcvT n=1 Tax=Clostridium botulinum TaxID=1491 RepID=UPI00099B5F66|nr:glycine cleavage system aminomethyltransferase GcvT [Clostridium botulinum]NFA96433.1 glycine cleavage system aminomethyltransferase GcvT [Clostridium botulinum]NFB51441.1 glycine cleavage system aminomethyltransferase GcvT [Clostridium botulinum]NFC76864.1 glycine cleavage system aminomethyltransferase GcvT [Clostridium botulinum]NFC87665.1 glycine cleavage system aminomethyltransferase GcvT [Clostridium botulinum]NFD05875.1 glycine cleavage system aminomethyltransferase GcvT [Clostridium 